MEYTGASFRSVRIVKRGTYSSNIYFMCYPDKECYKKCFHNTFISLNKPVYRVQSLFPNTC